MKRIVSFIVFTLSLNSFAFTSATSESTDSVSSTSGSIKRLFTQNEKEQMQHFVHHNFERLQEDAARGSGVAIHDYVLLMGCQQSHEQVTKALQKNYKNIFANGKSEVIQRTENLFLQNPQLAQACDHRS